MQNDSKNLVWKISMNRASLIMSCWPKESILFFTGKQNSMFSNLQLSSKKKFVWGERWLASSLIWSYHLSFSKIYFKFYPQYFDKFTTFTKWISRKIARSIEIDIWYRSLEKSSNFLKQNRPIFKNLEKSRRDIGSCCTLPKMMVYFYELLFFINYPIWWRYMLTNSLQLV